MKYYIIAGEASGDLHGANLMRALSREDDQARFRVWGGDRMEAAGGELIKHYRELAFMGFAEVLMNLKTILGNIAFCKKDIESFEPDTLILVDYPGFNMRIAKWAKERGIKVIYYISPQVWAWKQKRVHQLKRDCDRILCILPFEQEFYQRFGMEVDFVGHPLLDAIDKRSAVDPVKRKKELGLDPDLPVIALLPGSRKQEISEMLPVMLKAAEKFENYQVVVAQAPSQNEDIYRQVAGEAELRLVNNRTYDLLEVTEVAAVTSGTATLETALFEVPEVVCYKGNWISYWIARQLIKVKYISLVNLIADRLMVTELIQAEMNSKRLKQELQKCITQRDSFLADFKELKQLLGGGGASQKAASIIVKELRN